jgi:hypothetical protein
MSCSVDAAALETREETDECAAVELGLELELELDSNTSEGVELRVRIKEYGALELNGIIQLVQKDVRLEVCKAIDGALAVCRCDHEYRVLTDFTRHFAPCRFDCHDGVRESPILRLCG